MSSQSVSTRMARSAFWPTSVLTHPGFGFGGVTPRTLYSTTFMGPAAAGDGIGRQVALQSPADQHYWPAGHWLLSRQATGHEQLSQYTGPQPFPQQLQTVRPAPQQLKSSQSM